jgi:rRNA maturation protein Nop10
MKKCPYCQAVVIPVDEWIMPEDYTAETCPNCGAEVRVIWVEPEDVWIDCDDWLEVDEIPQ